MRVPRKSQEYEKVEVLWKQRVHETASELCSSFLETTPLHIFLKEIAEELVAAGNSPFFGVLFGSIGQIKPVLAVGLARELISGETEASLAAAWPTLLEANPSLKAEERLALLEQAACSRNEAVRVGLIRSISSRVLKGEIPDVREQALVIDMTTKASVNEASALLQLVKWSDDSNVSWSFPVLEKLPLGTLADLTLEFIMEALIPYKERKTLPPKKTVKHVLTQLVSVPDFDIHHHHREWEVLVKNFSREVYDWVYSRITYAAAGKAERSYCPIPHGYKSTFGVPELAKESDFQAICADLWQRAFNPNEKHQYYWLELFRAIVLDHPSFWRNGLMEKIAAAVNQESLLWLAQFLRFQGSLIIFHFPEITRAFLKRAKELGGDSIYKDMRSELYIGCGPQGRLYTGGRLDPDDDYVEAAAAKAAEAHASDDLLGPFFRWIVETEQKERLKHKMQSEADMASLD